MLPPASESEEYWVNSTKSFGLIKAKYLDFY